MRLTGFYINLASKNKWIRWLFIILLVQGLIACSTHKTSIMPTIDAPSETHVRSLEECDISLSTEIWIHAFVLPASLRIEALRAVETPDNNQQMLLRAILLTHSEASYRELKEAESLLLKQLTFNDETSVECESKKWFEYILKLNQMLQKQKSEIVLFQRQLNEQNKTIKTQANENAELHKKIEALTNIEHRMKLRSKKIEPEVSQ